MRAACRRDGYRGCAFINAAAEAPVGTPIHERTVAHKQSVLAWVRDLAGQTGTANPDVLAHALTLLLDGGLSDGAVSGSADAAEVAKSTARVLIGTEVARPA